MKKVALVILLFVFGISSANAKNLTGAALEKEIQEYKSHESARIKKGDNLVKKLNELESLVRRKGKDALWLAQLHIYHEIFRDSEKSKKYKEMIRGHIFRSISVNMLSHEKQKILNDMPIKEILAKKKEAEKNILDLPSLYSQYSAIDKKIIAAAAVPSRVYSRIGRDIRSLHELKIAKGWLLNLDTYNRGSFTGAINETINERKRKQSKKVNKSIENRIKYENALKMLESGKIRSSYKSLLRLKELGYRKATVSLKDSRFKKIKKDIVNKKNNSRDAQLYKIAVQILTEKNKKGEAISLRTLKRIAKRGYQPAIDKLKELGK